MLDKCPQKRKLFLTLFFHLHFLLCGHFVFSSGNKNGEYFYSLSFFFTFFLLKCSSKFVMKTIRIDIQVRHTFKCEWSDDAKWKQTITVNVLHMQYWPQWIRIDEFRIREWLHGSYINYTACIAYICMCKHTNAPL